MKPRLAGLTGRGGGEAVWLARISILPILTCTFGTSVGAAGAAATEAPRGSPAVLVGGVARAEVGGLDSGGAGRTDAASRAGCISARGRTDNGSVSPLLCRLLASVTG